MAMCMRMHATWFGVEERLKGLVLLLQSGMHATGSADTGTPSNGEAANVSALQELGTQRGIDFPDLCDLNAGGGRPRGHCSWNWSDAEWQLPQTSLQSAEASICSIFQDDSSPDVYIEESDHCASLLPQMDLAGADLTDFFSSETSEAQSSLSTS